MICQFRTNEDSCYYSGVDGIWWNMNCIVADLPLFWSILLYAFIECWKLANKNGGVRCNSGTMDNSFIKLLVCTCKFVWYRGLFLWYCVYSPGNCSHDMVLFSSDRLCSSLLIFQSSLENSLSSLCNRLNLLVIQIIYHV